MAAATVPNEICLAFKRCTSKEKIGARLLYNLVAFTYIHVELLWPTRCSGDACIYCKSLKGEPDEKRQKLAKPACRIHMLSYTVVEKYPVSFRIDREFDVSYQFLRVPMGGKTYTARTFLQAQLGKPYHLPRAQQHAWLKRSLCSCWLLCCCQQRCKKEFSIKYKMHVETNEMDFSNQKGWFCSQLIAVALNEAGFDLIVDSPDALFASLCNVKGVIVDRLPGVRVSTDIARSNNENRTTKGIETIINIEASNKPALSISSNIYPPYDSNIRLSSANQVSLLRLTKNSFHY